MKVTQQFDFDNNIHEDIRRHPKRTVEMDMNKLLHTESKVFEHSIHSSNPQTFFHRLKEVDA